MPALRVLIVDDQQSFRDAARELLRARGHVVVAEAPCGRTALEAAARFAPDAVLLDVRLERESGFVVARALIDAHPDLCVLLTSPTIWASGRNASASAAPAASCSNSA